jgi:hypothetical protein
VPSQRTSVALSDVSIPAAKTEAIPLKVTLILSTRVSRLIFGTWLKSLVITT